MIDLLEGDISINLSELFDSLEGSKFTTLTVPLEPVLESLINSTAGIDADLLLAKNFTVVEGFEAPEGKFPTTLGDAVMIDCNQAKSMIFDSYQRVFEQIVDE